MKSGLGLLIPLLVAGGVLAYFFFRGTDPESELARKRAVEHASKLESGEWIETNAGQELVELLRSHRIDPESISGITHVGSEKYGINWDDSRGTTLFGPDVLARDDFSHPLGKGLVVQLVTRNSDIEFSPMTGSCDCQPKCSSVFVASEAYLARHLSIPETDVPSMKDRFVSTSYASGSSNGGLNLNFSVHDGLAWVAEFKSVLKNPQELELGDDHDPPLHFHWAYPYGREIRIALESEGATNVLLSTWHPD